nr:SDR family oxidoreductase [Frankia sp. Cppng1_Ct_nod]
MNVSSDAAHQPGEDPYASTEGPVMAAYGTSKAALEHLTRCVAYELQRYGVSVNALLPSLAIRTPGLIATAGEPDEQPTPRVVRGVGGPPGPRRRDPDDRSGALQRRCAAPRARATRLVGDIAR